MTGIDLYISGPDLALALAIFFAGVAFAAIAIFMLAAYAVLELWPWEVAAMWRK